MNYRIIAYFLGQVMRAEAIFLLISLLVAVYYQETAPIWAFAATIVILLFISLPLIRKKPAGKVLHAKEGLLIVAFSWIIMSLFGALPFYFSGAIPSYLDSVFEAVSGFTTTGASILADVEIMPLSILFWRSFTHWIGGLGILVFLITIVSMTGGSTIHLMRAESPGPSTDKLLPRIRETAKILYLIYILLTVAEVILLVSGKMPLFDSLLTSFGTAGTGGFGIKNNSIAYYDSAYLQWVIGIFMLLFGVNFAVYFLIWRKKFSKAIKYEELLWYLGIVGAAVLFVTINIFGSVYYNFSEAARHAFFQVSSIITTTGYATADFNLWPQFSRVLLLFLMFVGACAGSTGGGFKIARLALVLKTVRRDIKKTIHPRAVETISFAGKPVEDETMGELKFYFILYFLILVFSNLLLSLEGMSFETTFSAAVSCLNNVGPGLDQVGPMSNYSAFSAGGKLVLMVNMLAGRLEIFPLLVLFIPGAWHIRKNKARAELSV